MVATRSLWASEISQVNTVSYQPVRTPISQLGEEAFPKRFSFKIPNINSQYSPVSISTKPEGYHDRLGDNPPANTGFALGHVKEHLGKRHV